MSCPRRHTVASSLQSCRSCLAFDFSGFGSWKAAVGFWSWEICQVQALKVFVLGHWLCHLCHVIYDDHQKMKNLSYDKRLPVQGACCLKKWLLIFTVLWVSQAKGYSNRSMPYLVLVVAVQPDLRPRVQQWTGVAPYYTSGMLPKWKSKSDRVDLNPHPLTVVNKGW